MFNCDELESSCEVEVKCREMHVDILQSWPREIFSHKLGDPEHLNHQTINHHHHSAFKINIPNYNHSVRVQSHLATGITTFSNRSLHPSATPASQ